MNEPKIIHAISGPRNISTALMYSFAQRPNCFVIDEPFYASFLKRTGLKHPGREETLNSYPNSPDGSIERIHEFIHSSVKEEIYLKNNVFINEEYNTDNAPMKMYTSYAIFYISKNLVETDRDVTIITSDSTTTGSGLSANMDTGMVMLLSNVKRTIKDSDGYRIIEGNQMIYDSNNKKWVVKDSAAHDLRKVIKKKVTTTFNIK